MNAFEKTALGKTIKTTLWIILAYALTTGTTYLTNYHWKASLVALGVPSIVNALLFAVTQFADKTIPNFPNSTPLVVTSAPTI
jgi:hypothetical protein